MHFDFASFLIGFVVAAVLGYVLFRMRDRITSLRQAAESQAGATRKFITNSSEVRYYNDLLKTLGSYHVAGDVVDLAEIYVEPRFLRAYEPVDPESEKTGVFHVIPVIPDLPTSYAPYNLETLSVHDLRAGETHLALLGLPGSGKSTALALIGLIATGQIGVESIDVMSDEIYADETKDMSPVEREKFIQQRRETQQRAIEHLQQAKQRDTDKADTSHSMAAFDQLMPILVHLRDIDLLPESFGGQTAQPAGDKSADKAAKPTTKALDPAEPLVKAMQRRANPITASTLPRMVYNRLTAGTCLVLIDGYEELAPQERAEKLVWLREFLAIYPNNFVVVTGPAVGFDPLLNAGLTPIYLRVWNDADYSRFVNRFAAAWPTIAGTARKPAPAPDEQIMRRVMTANRGRLPLDVLLKVWAAFSGDEQDVGRLGWYDAYIRRRLGTAEIRPLLDRVAAEILDHQGAPVSRDRIKELAAADRKVASNLDDTLNKLLNQSRLMVNWPGNGYTFSHPLITAFLASETLGSADPATLSVALANPAWDEAFGFAAIKLPMTEAVTQRLGTSPDLLYSGLFSLVNWLPDGAPNAPWRAEVFKRLTAALLTPNQFPVIRERAMAALVASRDKNILFILRQALRSTDPEVRRLACVGLGALGETDAIKDLGPMLTDGTPDVQLAAGMALGAIGTEAALETMVGGLLEGDQTLRQAVAEALAAVPGEGHAILRDGVTSPDMLVRRAAVFGLSRIKAAWALSLLYRALLEDAEWFVRNAAEEAFRQAEGLESEGALRQPEADALPWLISWTAKKGEGVPAGQNARQVLIRVLQEGEPPDRIAAAQTLANLGHVPALKPLYNALRDKDDQVRAAVYASLGTIQTRVGERFPAVV